MSTIPTSTVATTSAIATGPTTLTTAIAGPTTITIPAPTGPNPTFVGFESIGQTDLTTVYSSANCEASSTLYVSSNYASCCAGACNLYTGCYKDSILAGLTDSQTCVGTSTCHMDFIYQTSGNWEDVTTAIYCAEYGALPSSYFRAQPTDGILSTSLSGTGNDGQGPNPLNFGLGGGIGGFVVLVIVFAFFYYCLRQCRGGGRRGGTSYPSQRRWPTSSANTQAGNGDWSRDIQEQREYERQMREEGDRQRRQADADAEADRQRQIQIDNDYNQQQQWNNNNN